MFLLKFIICLFFYYLFAVSFNGDDGVSKMGSTTVEGRSVVSTPEAVKHALDEFTATRCGNNGGESEINKSGTKNPDVSACKKIESETINLSAVGASGGSKKAEVTERSLDKLHASGGGNNGGESEINMPGTKNPDISASGKIEYETTNSLAGGVTGGSKKVEAIERSLDKLHASGGADNGGESEINMPDASASGKIETETLTSNATTGGGKGGSYQKFEVVNRGFDTSNATTMGGVIGSVSEINKPDTKIPDASASGKIKTLRFNASAGGGNGGHNKIFGAYSLDTSKAPRGVNNRGGFVGAAASLEPNIGLKRGSEIVVLH